MCDATRLYKLLKGRNQVFIIFLSFFSIQHDAYIFYKSSTNFNAMDIILIVSYVQSWATWDLKWNLWGSLQFGEMLDTVIDGNETSGIEK